MITGGGTTAITMVTITYVIADSKQAVLKKQAVCNEQVSYLQVAPL